jgi:hypothetical protein
MDNLLQLLRLSGELDKQHFFVEADKLEKLVISQVLPTKGIFRSPNSKGTLRSKTYSLHNGQVYDKNGDVIGHKIDEDGNIYHQSSKEPVGRLKEKSIRIYRKKKEDTNNSTPSLDDNVVFEKELKV